MNEDISRILDQLRELEAELQERLHRQETRMLYRIEGTRVEFEQHVRETHERIRVHLLRWLAHSNFRNVLSAPFIYSMIIPFAVLDMFLSVYQAVCFRLYRIPRVVRSHYIVLDRHQLQYLNSVQRLNCLYCGYANGLIAYVREIAARTEQYWCPIKHARRVRDSHKRYAKFLDYGETEDLAAKLRRMREDLIASESKAK